MMPTRAIAKIFTLLVIVLPLETAAELTSVELTTKTDWRYFFSDGEVEAAGLHSAMTESGFYQNWGESDFDEVPVGGVRWETGSLPIGYPARQEYGTGLTPLPSTRPPLYLRKQFTVPDSPNGPVGLQVIGEDGITISLNGDVVLFRDNCCVDPQGNPITESRPTLLDFATNRNSTSEVTALGELSPGEYTLSATVHHTNDNRFPILDFDVRLFTAGNERPFSSGDTSSVTWADPNNWLFGLPGPENIATFGPTVPHGIFNDTDVTVAGLHFSGNQLAGGAITLGGNDQVGEIKSAQRSKILSDVNLANDTQIDVRGTLEIEGTFSSNGHTITKTGSGVLSILNASGAGEPSTLDLQDGTLSGGSLHGNIVSSGGEIRLLGSSFGTSGTLTVSGDVTAPVVLRLTAGGRRVPLLSGQGQGALTIDELTVEDVGRGVFLAQDGLELEFFPQWEAISIIGDVTLPEISPAEWDLSQLNQGIVSITNSAVEKCDFDNSGLCDISDIDAILSAVNRQTNDLQFDMNDDGVLTMDDRDEWLALAGGSLGYGPFLTGDANLDGNVDAIDLMTIGGNWQSVRFGWGNGDFNGDGFVNAMDLNALGKNWQASVERLAEPTAVPEPMGYLLVFMGIVGLGPVVRRMQTSTLATLMVMSIVHLLSHIDG